MRAHIFTLNTLDSFQKGTMKKLIYGVNVTDDKNNESLDGSELVCFKISADLESKINSETDERNRFVNGQLKPLYVPMFAGMISFILLLIVGSFYEILREHFPNSSNVLTSILVFLTLVFVPSLIVSIILILKLKRNLANSEKMKETQEKLEESYNLAIEQLEIPSVCQKMDIIRTRYWYKKNKYKVKGVDNVDCVVWIDIDAFKICNLRSILCIPLQSITSVVQVKRKLAFSMWNKEKKPSKDEYKKYFISKRNEFPITIRCFYIITITHDGEEYELHLPNYEIDSFRKLTGYRG